MDVMGKGRTGFVSLFGHFFDAVVAKYFSILMSIYVC